jgi:hypothetical protein
LISIAGLLIVVACCGLAGYLAGLRHQRYTQARADVRDTQGKLLKARKARSALRADALTAWLALGVGLLLLFAVALATR